MHTQDDGHVATAVAALATREYAAAGDAYSRAGWHVLAAPRADRSPFDDDERGYVGTAIQYLLMSAVCYRVAGRADRATHRGVEGIALARDLDEGLTHPVQRACLAEFVADARVAGGLDGAAAAYESAAERYRDAGGAIDAPQRWATTPLFEAAAAPIKQVARGLSNGEIAIEWADLHGSDPADPGRFLAHRATYKRQRFSGLLERSVDAGTLAAPRGTTEYGTDHHRCPHCDSRDVNWVADSVLCLRCSRPTEPQ